MYKKWYEAFKIINCFSFFLLFMLLCNPNIWGYCKVKKVEKGERRVEEYLAIHIYVAAIHN